MEDSRGRDHACGQAERKLVDRKLDRLKLSVINNI